MENNVTFQEAFNYLKDVPEEQFNIGSYKHNGQSCSLGLLTQKFLNHTDGVPRCRIYNPLGQTVVSGAFSEISFVNDGCLIDNSPLNKYIEVNSTPKQRILSYLEDIIKEGSGDCKIFIPHGKRL